MIGWGNRQMLSAICWCVGMLKKTPVNSTFDFNKIRTILALKLLTSQHLVYNCTHPLSSFLYRYLIATSSKYHSCNLGTYYSCNLWFHERAEKCENFIQQGNSVYYMNLPESHRVGLLKKRFWVRLHSVEIADGLCYWKYETCLKIT